MDSKTDLPPVRRPSRRRRLFLWILAGSAILVAALFLSAQRSLLQPRPGVVVKRVVLLIALTIQGG